jgi:20S proteasome alpha/beta subunit
MKTQVKISLQEAWDVIAEHLNEQEQLTFFVSPWIGEVEKRGYTLYHIDDNGNKVDMISATKGWVKNERARV